MTDPAPPTNDRPRTWRGAGRSGAALLLAALVTACGGRRADGDLVPPRTAIEGLGTRRCEYLDRRPVPAALDELTRPGTRGSILLWGRGAMPGDTVEVSVRYASEGEFRWARPIRSTAAPEHTAELERMLVAGLPQRADRQAGFRVVFVGGEVDAVLPSVACPAEPTGSIPRVLPPAGTRQEMTEAFRRRQGPISVLADLDEQGRVVAVRMAHSTGSRLLDQYAIETVRAMSFKPELYDGMPIPATTTVRLRLGRR